jgi:hypothetical protein
VLKPRQANDSRVLDERLSSGTRSRYILEYNCDMAVPSHVQVTLRPPVAIAWNHYDTALAMSSMINLPDTTHSDLSGTFNNVGRDQINIDLRGAKRGVRLIYTMSYRVIYARCR